MEFEAESSTARLDDLGRPKAVREHSSTDVYNVLLVEDLAGKSWKFWSQSHMVPQLPAECEVSAPAAFKFGGDDVLSDQNVAQNIDFKLVRQLAPTSSKVFAISACKNV